MHQSKKEHCILSFPNLGQGQAVLLQKSLSHPICLYQIQLLLHF